MSSLIVGASGSYVGESFVGDGRFFFFTSTGSIAFSGQAVKQIHSNFSTSGSIALSGTVPRQVTKSTSGYLTFSGAAGKHYAKAWGGYINFSGTAIADWAGTTFGFAATGGISFSGSAEVFNSRIEIGGKVLPGSLVGELLVGYSYVGTYPETPGLVFTGSASANKQSTKLAQGGISFSGSGSAVKSALKQAGQLSTDRLTFTGTATVDFTGSTASVWTGSLLVGAQAEVIATTVWDIDDPNNAGNLLGNATVWKESSSPDGVIVEDASAWG